MVLLAGFAFDASMCWLVVSSFALLPPIVLGTRKQRALTALFVGFALAVALRFADHAARSAPARLKARLIGCEAELAKLRAELRDRSAAESAQGATTTPK
jgi:hypothetical protein